MSSPNPLLSGIDNTSNTWTPASTTPPVDPFNQTVTLSDAYGNPLVISMAQFNFWAQYAIRVNIVWGCQIGAAFTLLLLLLILTKHEKRRSPIFIFNILALVLCIVRAVLVSLYYTGNWYDVYAYMALDYSRITTTDLGISIAASTMSLFLTICVEISLIMQAYIVCITVKRCYRIVITVLSVLAALTVIGIRFALTVLICMMTMGSVPILPPYLAPAADISLSVSISFFCLVFCGKLGLAIRNRRKLGLKQFGPMQIIFIMGAQTLVIPSMFSILQFIAAEVPEMGTLVLTVVSVFLPLSSIWAAANTDERNQASRGHNAYHKLLGGFRWKKAVGERKSSYVSENSTAPFNNGPVSPASRKTTSTYNTESTCVDWENSLSDRAMEASNRVNLIFP